MATQINLAKYCTQAEYSKLTGVKLGTLSQWIKRHKEGKSIPVTLDYKYVPELSLTLIKRP